MKKVVSCLLGVILLLSMISCADNLGEGGQNVIRDGIRWIDDELYYVKDGEIITDQGWIKVANEYYYVGENGYLIRNAWQGTHYLLSDGKMARDQFIDRFYVNTKGTWANNNFKAGNWRVDGTWYYVDDICYFKSIDGTVDEIDTNRIRSINRLGYDTVRNGAMPQQSLVAYKAALENGFSILLCDLRYTYDDVPVCFHDAYINEIARNSDGSKLAEEKISVSNTTFNELLKYDYGVYKDARFAGTRLLTFDEMIRFCEEQGVEELYIEIKDGNKTQLLKTVSIAKTFSGKISWAASTYEQAVWIVDADPKARISLMPYNIDDALIRELVSLQTGENEVFIFAFANCILTDEIVKTLKEHNIAFEMGTINSEQEILNYWNGIYHYCSGIESDTVIASKINIEKVLNISR